MKTYIFLLLNIIWCYMKWKRESERVLLLALLLKCYTFHLHHSCCLFSLLDLDSFCVPVPPLDSPHVSLSSCCYYVDVLVLVLVLLWCNIENQNIKLSVLLSKFCLKSCFMVKRCRNLGLLSWNWMLLLLFIEILLSREMRLKKCEQQPTRLKPIMLNGWTCFVYSIVSKFRVSPGKSFCFEFVGDEEFACLHFKKTLLAATHTPSIRLKDEKS